jgi:tRNA threonylcarbamoyl adenosine modification protein YeaZ
VIEVALDTASDIAGVAVCRDGALLTEVTWKTDRNHSRELLPMLDWALERNGLTKDDIGAVFVCLGPGSYAGLRVGLGSAKALAYGLSIPIAGIGRLAAEAAPLAAEGGPAVYAVNAAGRADLAWAAYIRRDGRLVELKAPRLGPAAVLVEAIEAGSFACGDLDTVEAVLTGKGVSIAPTAMSRVIAVASLGHDRLVAGDLDDAESLTPLYLREPAIGPQPPR